MRLAPRLAAVTTLLGLVIGSFTSQLGAQTPAALPDIMSIPVSPASPSRPSAAATAGAVAINVFRVPGKAFLCGLGTLTAGGLMLLTFGTQYRAASAVFREGCGGKWVIGPSDLDRDVEAPKAISAGNPS